MEATPYQWLALALGFLGFLVTWTGGIIGAFKAVSNIKEDTTEKIAAVELRIEEKVAELLEKFVDEQRVQDQRFGEVGAAMRQKIADVEKEMHAIEIWGRDNYVLKSEFIKATDQIRADIKAMGSEIKTDIKELTSKLNVKN